MPRVVSPLRPTCPKLPARPRLAPSSRSAPLRIRISRTSKFTEGMHSGRKPPASEESGYRIIGRGTAGTIFEIPGSELAVKKGPNVDAIWDDFRLTNKVNKAFADDREMLQALFPEMVIQRLQNVFGFSCGIPRIIGMPILSAFPSLTEAQALRSRLIGSCQSRKPSGRN